VLDSVIGPRTFLAVGAAARLAALLSYVATDPPVGPSVGPGPRGVGTVTLFALYAASGVALLAAVPWSAGRAGAWHEQAVLVKGAISLGLAGAVALFGALHALVLVGGIAPLAGPGDTLAYVLTGLCALVDLAATGLGLRRLRHWALSRP
jgi:hypothetical protein